MYNNDKKLKSSDYYLPGRYLKEDELIKLIENSRSSGMISLKDAHSTIRQNKKPLSKGRTPFKGDLH